jgi:lysophospholipase L1-like esterase
MRPSRVISSIKRKLNPQKTTAGFTHYIALGDSISTDDYPGEGKGAVSLLYRNENLLYPKFEGQDLETLHPGITFVSLVQDGATTSDVLRLQVPEAIKLDAAYALFTLTAGGNDILSLQAMPEEVLSNLRGIVKILSRTFANSRILVGTIYDPTDGVGDLLEPDIPLKREMSTLRKINEQIRSEFSIGNVAVIDIYQHFLGHGNHCHDPGNAHYHPEDPTCWYMMMIEPNVRGAHEVRKLFLQALQNLTAKDAKSTKF